MLSIQRILHPTDLSKYSNSAFHLACALARDYGSRLTVLHVSEPLSAIASEGVLVVPAKADEDFLREKLHQITPQDSKVQMEHRLVEGDPATEILRISDETKCDLIVIGTHGRSGLGRLLLGSVAEKVVRKALCPVLTVKLPLDENL